MCAWPMATARCRTGVAEVLGHRRRDAPLGAAATSGSRSSVRSRARSSLTRRGSSSRMRAHHAVEHLEVVGERFGLRVDDDELGLTEAVDRRVAGGVERAERRRRNCGNDRVRRRLEEQRDVAGRRHRARSSCGAGGCPAAAVQRAVVGDVDDAGPRTGSRRRSGGSRGRSRPRPACRPTRRDRDPSAGTTSSPTARPTSYPASNGSRWSRSGPASMVSGRRSGWTSGRTRSHSSRWMRFSIEVPIVVHDPTLLPMSFGATCARRNSSTVTVISRTDDADVEGFLTVAAVADLVSRRGRRCRAS